MLLNLGINSLLISGETWLTRMEGKVLMQNIVVGYVQVKLGEPGWRERYYEEKFGARTPEQIEEIRRDVVSFSLAARGNLFVTVPLLSLVYPTCFGLMALRLLLLSCFNFDSLRECCYLTLTLTL